MARPSEDDVVAGANDASPRRRDDAHKASKAPRPSDDTAADAAADDDAIEPAVEPTPPVFVPAIAAAASKQQQQQQQQQRHPTPTTLARRLLLPLALPLLLAALLVHLPWEPRSVDAGGVDFGFERDVSGAPDFGARLDNPHWLREVVTFPAEDGTPLEAWVYMPRTPVATVAAGGGQAGGGDEANAGGGGGGDEGDAAAPSSSLLLPPSPPPPVVVIGQGLGAQKDMGLPLYAQTFAASGLAVFAFDYRGFGGSGGEPRHVVSPRRHVSDWASAVAYVSSGALATNANLTRHYYRGGGASPSTPPLVDGSRVGLSGFSYSGGHVLVTAATKGVGADTGGPVRAVVSNEPFLTGKTALARAPLERGLVRVLRLVLAAASDVVRAALGMPAVYVRLAAPISDARALSILSLLDSDLVAQRSMASQRAAQQARSDALASGLDAPAAERAAEAAAARVHRAEHRPARQGGWKNVIAARFIFAMLGYEPIDRLGDVRVPVFLRVATLDHICPPETAERALRLFGTGELTVHRSRVSHIQALIEGARPEQIAPVVAFYRRHLGVEGGGGGVGVEGGGEGEGGVLEAMEQEEGV